MKKLFAALVMAGLLAASTAASAAAATDPGPPELSADPTTITVQEYSTITASNLPDGTTAYFSTDQGGQIVDERVLAVGGIAQTGFFATTAGTYRVYLGDGETNFLDVEITVTGIADPGGPGLSADPTAITVGGSSTVTASNLENGSTAFFSTDEGGTLTASEVVASDGTAQTTFTAAAPGSYFVYLGDGETTIAEVQITVDGLVDEEITDPGPPQLAAAPASITVDSTSIVTASNLEVGAVAYFSVSPGGALSASEVTATNGAAQTTFSAGRAGTYTVYLGDGETTIAEVRITVTPKPIAVLPATGDDVPVGLVWAGNAAVALGAIAVSAAFATARRARRP